MSNQIKISNAKTTTTHSVDAHSTKRTPRRMSFSATLFVLALSYSVIGVQAQEAKPNSASTQTQRESASPSTMPRTDASPAVERDKQNSASETMRARRVSSASPIGSKKEATANVSTSPVPSSLKLAVESPSKNVSDTKHDAANTDTASSVTEAELEEMRAPSKDAKTDAERARLQRALVERLIENNHKSEAVSELRLMIGEDRFDPPHFYNIGNALARLGDTHNAIEAYRKAISQRRGNYARAQNNLGVVLMRLGRWDEAQEALAAALRQENFTYAEASYNMGRLHALRGEAGLAIREWTRTLSLQPNHTDAAVALARAYAEDGDAERGVNVLDAFAKRSTRRGGEAPSAIAIARGEIVAAGNIEMEESGGTKSAETLATKNISGGNSLGRKDVGRRASSSSLLRPLAVDQTTYDLLQNARNAREAGRLEEAAALYRRVLSRRGGYFPPANLELGYALVSLQRNDQAIESFQPVAAKDGARYPVSFYHLGRLYERTGDLSRAAEAFTRAATLYSDDNAQFLLDLSRVREKEGKMAEAIQAMEDYVKASERTGNTPDWARERLNMLRQKLEAAAQNPKQ
jgi:tetratricopeptide (TPR) repeat protein